MSEKNQIALYKINTDHVDLHDAVSMVQKVNIIVEKDTLKKQERNTEFNYTSLRLNEDLQQFSPFQVRAYRYEQVSPNGWQDFLSDAFVDVPRLLNKNHSFLFFLFDDVSIFCFAGGNGHNAVMDFSDVSFPIDLMKRLVDPDKIKKAKSRGITGELYARDLYFRRYSAISATEAFGQVWKDLSASIKTEVWEDPDMSSILGKDKKVNVEVKASFKIRKKVSFEELIRVLVKVKEYLDSPISEEVTNAFAFLDSVTLISGFTRKEELKDEVKRKIFAYIHKEEIELDFDFCHADFEDFFSANLYRLRCRSKYIKDFTEHPSAEEVFDLIGAYMRQDKPTALIDFDEFSEELDSCVLESKHDEFFTDTSGRVFDHLHGEVSLDERTYFLVDKEWYLVKDNFLELLKADFEGFISGGVFIDRATLGMRPWPNGEKEGPYNDSYKGNRNFIVGDKIIQDGIEFFDLLVLNRGGDVYIVQTKNKFGGKTRESCSQIRNAAKVIESAVKGQNHKKLREIYRKLAALPDEGGLSRTSGLSEDQFVETFTDKKRIYVLALGGNATPESLKLTRSNIARFETLTVRDVLRMYDDVDFKLTLL